MRDIEQPRGSAGMQVLLQDAGGKLHRHLIARERHHFGARGDMQSVKRRAFQGAIGIARKHHGALAVGRDPSPERTIEAPSVAVPESIIPSADTGRAKALGASFQMLSSSRGPFA